MIILSIETSCDDTSIAIIEAEKSKKKGNGFNWTNFNILSNIVSSQVKVHQKYGGVYPTLAKREHQRNLLPVLIRALKKSKLLKLLKNDSASKKIKNSKLKNLNSILEREPKLLKQILLFFKKYEKPKIEGIAITTGPGLEPCLWTGVNFTKALGYFWNLPVIPINHIEAHILANFINGNKNQKVKFPILSLIVSGGHTQLILMKYFGKYKIIGETRDDAAGECFDKIARILGLDYPGGPIIAQFAKQRKSKKINLPRPMIHQKNYDFSFSGLKTAVLYNFQNQSIKTRKSKKYIQEICAETQQAIIDVLIHKTIKAVKDYKAKTIIIGGGVSANQELRKQLKEKIKKELPNVQYLTPNIKLCTDNAAMIAVTAFFHWTSKEKYPWKKIEVKSNLRL